jgi:hypothetical protein
MTRRVVVRAAYGLVFSTSLALAQDLPPPLTPPVLGPLSSETDAGSPSLNRSTPATSESRPLLLIPGVTAPIAPRQAARTARSKAPAAPVNSPLLTGPSAPRNTLPSSPTEVQAREVKPAARVQVPLTLEPIPDEPPPELGSERSSTARSAPMRAPQSSPIRPLNEPAADPGLAPRRAPAGLFGWLHGPLNAGDDRAEPGSSVTVEPGSDPAAEAVVKRRIEREIQQSLGARVSLVEVRVIGRNVLIKARASRFWQRWTVRRTLESVPIPSGYRSHVEMLD